MTLTVQARRAIDCAGDLPTGLTPPELRRVYAAQRARLQPPRPEIARVVELSIPGRDGEVAARLEAWAAEGAGNWGAALSAAINAAPSLEGLSRRSIEVYSSSSFCS